MRLTYLTCNFYPLVVQFAPDPSTSEVWVLMVSGGGGGMGSEIDMSYSDVHPIPYSQYGGMGGPVMVDTLPSADVVMHGARVTWPGHMMQPNQALFLDGPQLPSGAIIRKPYFVIRNSITSDSFEVSEVTYRPPGPPPFPHLPAPLHGDGIANLTPFRYTLPGSAGGGPQGDQGGSQAGVGFPTRGDGYWFAGEPGSCCAWGGGRGGGNPFGPGAIEQFGGMEGNTGGDPGGGGSGGGLGAAHIYNPMSQQVGPSDGASGSWGLVKLPRKDLYDYFCGEGGRPGPAGPGGFDGGRGGHPALIFLEF